MLVRYDDKEGANCPPFLVGVAPFLLSLRAKRGNLVRLVRCDEKRELIAPPF